MPDLQLYYSGELLCARVVEPKVSRPRLLTQTRNGFHWAMAFIARDHRDRDFSAGGPWLCSCRSCYQVRLRLRLSLQEPEDVPQLGREEGAESSQSKGPALQSGVPAGRRHPRATGGAYAD